MKLDIYERFPSLKWKLPSASLLNEQTPLIKLTNIGKHFGHNDLWIKRDDLTSSIYGGNKVRKLDFILAMATKKKIKAVCTSGAIGSHHVLATCIYAKKLGLKVGTIQFSVTGNFDFSDNQKLIDRVADWKIPVRHPFMVTEGVIKWKRECVKKGLNRNELMVIPPGGSSSLGCMGYVNAALEIEKQRTAMGLKPFDMVFVPFGTGGTMVGLSIGFKLTGVSTRVIGVRITSPLIANVFMARWLESLTIELIEQKLGKLVAALIKKNRRSGFEIMTDYLGKGYGYFGAEEESIIRLLEEKENISLDPVYTAKTMKAFIEVANNQKFKDKKLLIVLTYCKAKNIKF